MKISGGDKLEARLKEIAQNVSRAAKVDVGFLEGATYPDGKPVAMIAAIQEFGAPARNIPPRPFFRGMINEKSPEWPDAVASLLKANDYDGRRTLEQTGAAIAGQLRQSIVETNSPPLSPQTIAAKGFEKPLVDTGHMLNSIEYDVKS